MHVATRAKWDHASRLEVIRVLRTHITHKGSTRQGTWQSLNKGINIRKTISIKDHQMPAALLGSRPNPVSHWQSPAFPSSPSFRSRLKETQDSPTEQPDWTRQKNRAASPVLSRAYAAAGLIRYLRRCGGESERHPAESIRHPPRYGRYTRYSIPFSCANLFLGPSVFRPHSRPSRVSARRTGSTCLPCTVLLRRSVDTRSSASGRVPHVAGREQNNPIPPRSSV